MKLASLILAFLIHLMPAGSKAVEIVAHRGASADAPENTLASIRLAWEQRADAAELDVYLSKDGRIVVLHDSSLKRTARVDREVTDLTLAELKTLDVGRWKASRFAGEPIPTLEEVLAIVPAGKRVFIEVKCGPEIVGKLERVIAASRLKPEQVVVIGFSADVVASLKKVRPDLMAYWLVSLGDRAEKKPFTAADLIARAKMIHADGIDLSASARVITPEFVRALKAAGLQVHVWTVDGAGLARAMAAAGVDGITTNRPGRLREQLETDVHDVRVMSFNIRYGTAADGENSWDKRKTFLLATIRAFGPDLLGTQETLASQRDFLAAGLAGYDVLAAGRNDGRERGEMTALFYRKERFEKLDGGHFWLSETPDRVGSKSWDSSLPRMVTWVKLRDRRVPDGSTIVYFNTHFDHRGGKARLESARLLRRKIAELGVGCRVVVTGDFNCGEGGEPYVALFGQPASSLRPVVDTFRAVHPAKTKTEGTFSGFHATSVNGERIDWIGCSTDWAIRDAAIDHTARDGRTPSDHFPVTAIIRPAAPGRVTAP